MLVGRCFPSLKTSVAIRQRHRSLVELVRRYSSQEKKSSTQSNHSISNQQLLYTTDPSSPGSIFFLPHGTRIFNKLVQFMKNQQMRYGFQEVITPLIYKTQLWEKSGHWENYKDDMFRVEGNDKTKEEVEEGDGLHEYGLKPMNCPGHCLIFSKFERSYNELPVRLSDFSSLHRNEASGALSGLTRVRRFHQDDGHIFCTVEQINDEIANTINLIRDTYRVFGIEDDGIQYFLSTRPEEHYIGDKQTWDKAEYQLKECLDANVGENKWTIRDGDGAFYGPKIDVVLTDAFGKVHQVGTVQLDFQLPARFKLKYVSPDGNRTNQPIMIHRAVFGSLERFFAIILDHFQGKWPFWLNPRQAVIIPISEAHTDAALALQKKLVGDMINNDDQVSPMTGYNFYVDVNSKSETLGSRIKDSIDKRYSFLLIIGDKEIDNETVSVRARNSKRMETMTADELYSKFIELEKNYK